VYLKSIQRQIVGVVLAVAMLGWGLGVAPAEADGPNGAIYTMSNNPSSNDVLVFHRAVEGTLMSAGSVPTGGLGAGGGLGNQGAVTLSDDGRWLLVVNPGSDDLSIFRVRHDDGHLTLTDRVPSGGTLPISVTIHRDVVYALNAGGSGNIAGFRLSPRGGLLLLPASIQPLSSSSAAPAQVSFSPKGDFLVVTEKDTNIISTYMVDHGGLAMGPNAQPSQGITPFGFAVDQRGRLFVSEASSGAPDASSLSSYELSADGTLQALDGSVPTTETAACWVAITPNGLYAYVTNTGSGTVTGFAIGPDGMLTRLDADGVTAAIAGGAPIDAAIDRSGRFLYVLDAGTDRIIGYSIRRDGSLGGIGDPVVVPDGASGLAAR
jgi:6-phosphogluconolactonase